jgi:hypothetical protein
VDEFKIVSSWKDKSQPATWIKGLSRSRGKMVEVVIPNIRTQKFGQMMTKKGEEIRELFP